MKHLRRDYGGAGLMSSLEPGQSSSSQLPSEPPRAELTELLPVEPSRPKASVLFKLTDECSAAIQEAVKKHYRVRLNYTKNSCTVEVGYDRGESEVKRFTCVVQSIGFPMDVLCIDKGVHRNISSLNSKIQVRATEKTFAETREKAQKLVEEQQKRKTMDMGQKFSKRPLMPKRQSTGPAAMTSFSKKPVVSQTKSSYQVSSNTPNPTQKFSKNAISIKPSNALAPTSKPNRTNTPLTEKVVEKSPPSATISSSPMAPVMAAKTRIALAPKATPPVVKTPTISPNLNSSSGQRRPSPPVVVTPAAAAATAPTTITPTRNPSETNDHPAFRKRPFSTHSNANTTKKSSPSSLNPPPETKRRNEYGSSFASNSISSAISSSNSSSGYGNSSSSSSAVFNGASASVLQPPVYQPSSAKKSGTVVVGTPVVVGAASSTSSSSSLTPDENLNRFHQRGGSLTQPTKPSRDWAQTFGDIKSFSEAKKYHDIFTSDYSEYYKCYKALSKVAKEFADLEKSLKTMQINTPDYDKMEEAIHSKFAKYQRDEQFLNRRQKHTDLRAKLELLKHRIAVWEKNARQNGLKSGEDPNNDQLKREALKTKGQQDSGLSSIDHMMLM